LVYSEGLDRSSVVPSHSRIGQTIVWTSDADMLVEAVLQESARSTVSLLSTVRRRIRDFCTWLESSVVARRTPPGNLGSWVLGSRLLDAAPLAFRPTGTARMLMRRHWLVRRLYQTKAQQVAGLALSCNKSSVSNIRESQQFATRRLPQTSDQVNAK
jgi:hypothetical protein